MKKKLKRKKKLRDLEDGVLAAKELIEEKEMNLQLATDALKDIVKRAVDVSGSELTAFEFYIYVTNLAMDTVDLITGQEEEKEVETEVSYHMTITGGFTP